MAPKSGQKFTLKYQMSVEGGVFKDGDDRLAHSPNPMHGKCDALLLIGLTEEDNRGWEEIWVRGCDGRNVHNCLILDSGTLFRMFLTLADEIKNSECAAWQRRIAQLTIDSFIAKTKSDPKTPGAS